MDNREKILKCALDLFCARGYDAVGVQEIAETAGITKPTLYYYFGSKRGLLETLLQTEYRELRRTIDEASWYEDDVPAMLYRVASAFIDYGIQNPKMYRLMMALFYSARENEAYQAVKPIVVDFFQRIVQVFETASDRLGNMNGRQKQFALGFIGIINHYLLFAEEKENEELSVGEEVKKSLVHQFMYGIFS
ncbi:MAG TPA: TetR/AcrR family transcriptional regulator [Candidatus Limivivens intestinipullorum]|uniref:TetR/AcrR family transcriptional regulator n=1 Tax=Candidatus Limivivens intestinipullorum TaxID=2840858 RepID=A0A9D1EQS9_9FIRM|nr:TetR/AcrR family transcriptional regulator [Candidatus Limivivens intestinipullorum]